MNYDFIFIITYGRSGSTLLQGILNSIDGVEIKGENGAIFRGLFNAVNQLTMVKTRFSNLDRGPQSPWFGIASVDVDSFIVDLRKAFVKNVLVPSSDTKVLGFKEIRYAAANIENDVNNLRKFFNKSAFIVNTRNIDDVEVSNKRAGHGISPGEIRVMDAALRAFAEAGYEDVFHIHYDDYIQDPMRLKPMFDFLGAEFDLDAVQEVLSKEHSTVTKSEKVRQEKSRGEPMAASDAKEQ